MKNPQITLVYHLNQPRNFHPLL